MREKVFPLDCLGGQVICLHHTYACLITVYMLSDMCVDTWQGDVLVEVEVEVEDNFVESVLSVHLYIDTADPA